MRHMNFHASLCTAALTGASIVGTGAWADQRQTTYDPNTCSIGPDMMMMGHGLTRDLGPPSPSTQEQRRKILKIQNDVRRQHEALMNRILGAQSQLTGQLISDERNDAALSVIHLKISALWLQICDLSLNTQKEVDAALSQE